MSCIVYYIYTVKNVVCYLTLRSANHTLIRVVNTTQCHMTHQLVWYAQFVVYSVGYSTSNFNKAKYED